MTKLKLPDSGPIKHYYAEQDSLEAKNFQKTVEKTFYNLVLVKYCGTKQSEYKCLLCGNKYKANLDKILGRKYDGCDKCAGKKKAATKLFLPFSEKADVEKAIIWLRKARYKKTGTRITFNYLGQPFQFVPFGSVGDKNILVYTIEELAERWGQIKAIAQAYNRKKMRLRVIITLPSGITQLKDDWYRGSVESLNAKLFLASIPAKGIRILAMDPATTNYGWSVLHITKDWKITVIATGMLRNVVWSMSGNISKEIGAFTEEVRTLIDCYECEYLAAERYQTRTVKGSGIECINLMLGILTSMGFREYKFVTAGEWKNEIGRKMSKGSYIDKEWLPKYYKSTQLVPHQIDATLIGIYCCARWMGRKPFREDALVNFKDLRKQLNHSNLGIRIKGRK